MPAKASLIGKWTFNEGGGDIAYDSSPAANHGVINGARHVASAGETSSNSALRFDGIDDFVQYAHHPSYDVAGDFSIEAWINVPNNAAEPLIFGQAVARLGLSAYRSSAFLYADNDPFTYKGGALTPNAYQHVVGVWDQSSQKVEIFVEGTSAGSVVAAPPTAAPAYNGDVYWTGKSNASGTYGFLTGEIDEVRYYNHALSQPEISTNFSIGPTRLELAYTELPPKVQVPYSPWEENLYYSHAFTEPGTGQVMRLAFSSPHEADTVIGAMTTKTWYQVSTDNGVTFDGLRPLIQSGDFDRMHPIAPVHILKNSYIPSVAPPMRASNGEILVPFYLWPLGTDGEPWNPLPGAYTYTDVGVLIGRWTPNGQDVEWELGNTVRLDQHTQSPRGAMEPAIIELSTPGQILMVMRGSNESNHDLPSYKWKSVSEDFGRTWSDSSPMTYADGENFFSASSASDIRRNSKNGQIYWFGNISENAFDNSPRYPFVFAQLDETTLGLFEPSVRVIDDIDPETDSPQMQLSISTIIENPEDGSYTVRLVRIDPGKPSEVLYYTVPIFPRGDTDFDNDVDMDDLAVLADNYNATGANWMQGDFDNDRDVDLADLTMLATHYEGGQSQAFADFQSLATVPEPSLVPILAIPCLAKRRNRRCFGYQEWKVQTDRGPIEFRVQECEDIRFLSDGRFSLKDADGNIYEMPKLDSLDEHTRKEIDALV